ncbi:hypothetical protein FOL46_006137 [Perkinsus olseni]|uniref:proton-translocating NAD(P)(+) transhydrogenase n=4 Tax=Perkinsus olseni TaxID=32597 RepID=A0A7J6MR13_PEROL|nr:hypothetical protein FOL46_006137 [Perkinsus olseni]
MSTFDNTTVCDSNLFNQEDWLEVVYIGSAVLFIMALRGLSKTETAKWGNIYGMLGMTAAVAGAWASQFVCDEGYWLIAVALFPGLIIGILLAGHVTMIQMPQMVGLLNAFGGLASALEALGLFLDPNAEFGPNGSAQIEDSERTAEVVIQTIAMFLSMIIGMLTFFGSIIACLKLNGNLASKARVPPFRTIITLIIMALIVTFCVLANHEGYGTGLGLMYMLFVAALSSIWGVLFVIAIGGADMPVVICILNTGSGFAGVCAGFMLANKLLVITGAFVGCSGAILSVIMCEAMNRSLWSTLVGGFGEGASSGGAKVEGEMREIALEELAETLNRSKEVIIVPGYGMAAAKAQHAVAQVTEILRGRGVRVRFGIHPVAGRLPGHMNVLLAEARVPYDIVLAMDEINDDFEKTDVTIVVGANDIVNPAAAEDPTCPIAGMPVLEVWKGKMTVVMKRGRGAGYSGVDNPLFVRENNRMFFGSAKPKMEELAGRLLELTAEGKKDVVEEVGAPEPAQEPDTTDATTGVEALVARETYYKLGVLKDRYPGEKRVALVPSICGKLYEKGYAIYVETNAGLGAGFSDEAYKAVGCEVLPDSGSLCAKAQMVFVIRPPPVDILHQLRGKYCVSWVGRLTDAGKKEIEIANGEGVNLVDVTAVPRITIAQKLDCLSSQAKIAGHRAVLEAAHEYQKFFAPEITAAGKYPPCRVMVLGAGVAGLAAIGTAVSLGAEVRAWDVRDVSDQVESMGGKWFSVDFKEEGAGSGGYAKESSDAFKAAQKATFHKHARECDIIITTAAIPGRPSPRLIEGYMVDSMKPGSVIVDLGAEGGGNCELTKKGESYLYKNNIRIIGYTDMASRMADQASTMFAANMLNFLTHVHSKGPEEAKDARSFESFFEANINESPESDIIVRSIVCCKDGQVLKMPPPPQPSPAVPKKTDAPGSPGQGGVSQVNAVGGGILASSQFLLLVSAGILVIIAIWAPRTFIDLLMVFVLAGFVGYMLVWNVQPALHTPLMSVSNAISGQVVLGGIFMVSSEEVATQVFAVAAIAIAAINIGGGFMVTHRMLSMFKRDTS